MDPEDNREDRLSFDEKPIGHGQKAQQLSEYPPDFNADSLNSGFAPAPLPLAKRVHSKVWKIRKEAFEELYNQVAENPENYRQFLKDTAKFIVDSTAVCQEKALKVFLKYLETAKQGLEDPKAIIKALIEKCLVVEKGEAANLATQVMFWVMDNYQQLLLNELNENMLNKNPKICASVLTFMQKLVNNYGAKKLKGLEEFTKSFTLLSAAVRPVAKQQTINLFKQMYKWMGENALNFNMHPEIKEEVVKFSKTYMRQAMVIKRGLNEDQKKGNKPLTENIDDDETDEPQDVLVPYGPSWVDNVLAQQKWNLKKQIMEEFLKKTKVRNIVPRETSHFITLLKRLLIENNINLLQCGLRIIKNLSKGLKRNFSHTCKVILDPVFFKLRDTKAMIVDETQETLELMLNCLTIEDFAENIRDGLKDKAPTLRLQTLKFIEKVISKKDKKMINTFKNLTSQIIQLNQDGSSEVRDKALDVLCKLKSSYGLNFFGDKLKKIQGKKLHVVQNYIDPNESKIDEEPIIDHDQERKNNNKVNCSGNQSTQQSVTANSKQSIISEPIQKSTPSSDFDSISQNTRLGAYQNLLQKNQQTIYSQLVQGFKNKVPMARECNPTILKVILNCIKKSVHNTVTLEQMQVLLYHDWKKCKPLLIDFIQNNKLNLQALEIVKNMGILSPPQGALSKRGLTDQSNNPSNINQSPLPTNILKTFYSSIQGLIPRMSSPEPMVRLQAVESAMQIIKQIPINAPNQLNNEPSATVTESMSQLFNVLKYRVQDSNEQIANSYISLVTELLSRGFFTKFRTPGRLLITNMLPKVANARLTNMQNFIQEMVVNHSLILWQYLPMELVKQNMCGSVLSIIRYHNESFFKNADQKSYILPLLNNISKDIEGQKCAELLDQIVQINGEQSLQKVVKQSKIGGFHVQNYLQKWKIYPNPTVNKSINNNIVTNVSLGHTKIQRLAAQIDNPWPLVPSPSHIYKLIGQMMSLGQPFQTLASPTVMTDHQLAILSNLRPQFIEEYSDLWTKWIFWRMHIETSPRNLQSIFNMIYSMIGLHNCELHQSQIITILGALSSCLTLHKTQYLSQITKINSLLNQHPFYKQKSFRFWINSFNDPSAPVDQILNLIVNSCSNMIPSEMVTLARYPAIVKNKEFNQYLRANYTEKLLTVYGFNLNDNSNLQQKATLSESLKLEMLTEVESKYFVELFERCSSNDLIQKIASQTKGIPDQFLMQSHLKIMYSIIVPYLRRQLSFLNVYNYFKELQKILVNPAISSNCLLNTVRTLAFFLIDLDMIKMENNAEMMKSVNKLLLILLEVSGPKHILQVLFVIMKHQLKINGNIKLVLLLPKCICKVIKNPVFKSQYQRSDVTLQCLTYITKQFVQIMCTFEMAAESSLIRAIRSLLTDMVVTYPQSSSILEDILIHNHKNLPEHCQSLIRSILQDKSKQNNNHNKQKDGLSSSDFSYAPSKDIKGANNFIKAIKPNEQILGSYSKNGDKMVE